MMPSTSSCQHSLPACSRPTTSSTRQSSGDISLWTPTVLPGQTKGEIKLARQPLMLLRWAQWKHAQACKAEVDHMCACLFTAQCKLLQVSLAGYLAGYVMGTCLQGALEVWDYSQRHLSEFAASADYSGRDIKFRHVPFAFFPVVSIQISNVVTYLLHLLQVTHCWQRHRHNKTFCRTHYTK